MGKFYYYSYENAEALVFDNYLINQIRVGANITDTDVDTLMELINKHFLKKPWVYISNRTASYSVDPMIYKRTSHINNLKGVAIVTQDDVKKKMAEFEKKFSDIPVVILDKLSDALNWADELCQ